MIATILAEVVEEYERARGSFPAFHSAHEAYAVVKEEVDEWWDSIKADHPDRKELIQVMAMCLASLAEVPHE